MNGTIERTRPSTQPVVPSARPDRRVTDEVRSRIAGFEGLRLEAGRNAFGVLTIGYGHNGPDVRPGQTISRQQAEELLRVDLAAAEAAVARLVTVPLTDNQFGALVAFVLNVGVSAFAGSALLRKLDAGDYDAVPAELLKWRHGAVRGRRTSIPGLVNRRAAEAGLWATGGFVASSAVPTQADPRTAEHLAGLLARPEGWAWLVATAATLGAAAQGGTSAWMLAGLAVASVGFAAFQAAGRRDGSI